MIDVPMQLIEEKKHYATSPVSKKRMACERCVYGSGEHSCGQAGAVEAAQVEGVPTSLCECGHPIECHADLAGCMVPMPNRIGFCECSHGHGRSGHNYALAQALGAAERNG